MKPPLLAFLFMGSWSLSRNTRTILPALDGAPSGSMTAVVGPDGVDQDHINRNEVAKFGNVTDTVISAVITDKRLHRGVGGQVGESENVTYVVGPAGADADVE